MRGACDAAKIRRFMQALGARATGPGRCYLTGGATAVLHGWREATVDIDVKFLPEPRGVFEALGRLKDELDVNVELASPDDFIPALPGWESRSRYIESAGPVEFFHYDFAAQALAKIERGHDRDRADVHAMLERELVSRADLRALFTEIEPALNRYPAIDPDAFRAKLERALGEDDS